MRTIRPGLSWLNDFMAPLLTAGLAVHYGLRHGWLAAAPWAGAWMGEGAERRCLEFQARFLREIEADPAVQEYVRGLMKKPMYQRVRRRDS